MQEITPESARMLQTLNAIIEINRDGQQDFVEAAQKIETQYIKAFCVDQSRLRARFVEELRPIVHCLAKSPDATQADTSQRNWSSLKYAMGGSNRGVLALVDFGEGHAVHEYQRVLEMDLPLGLRDILERQYDCVRLSHIKISAMLEGVGR